MKSWKCKGDSDGIASGDEFKKVRGAHSLTFHFPLSTVNYVTEGYAYKRSFTVPVSNRAGIDAVALENIRFKNEQKVLDR